eukprot:scaffold2858_cov659-Pavlova_lutheri.AAC.121
MSSTKPRTPLGPVVCMEASRTEGWRGRGGRNGEVVDRIRALWERFGEGWMAAAGDPATTEANRCFARTGREDVSTGDVCFAFVACLGERSRTVRGFVCGRR